MLGGADNPNGELPSYITGADRVGLMNWEKLISITHTTWTVGHAC